MTNYNPSVNIRYSFEENNLFDDYIPTMDHMYFIQSLYDATVDGSSLKCQILRGPYGTGKSLIVSMALSLLSNKIDSRKKRNLIQKIKNSFPDMRFIKQSATSKQWIPVILETKTIENGFLLQVVKATSDILQDNRVLYMQNIKKKVMIEINRWKRDFYDTYEMFNTELLNENYTLEFFLESIEKKDEEAIKFFQDTYYKLTSGKEFMSTPETVEELIDYLETVDSFLEEKSSGINIVFDEFGRYLNTVKEDGVQRLLIELQSLAEYINSKAKNITLTLVSHMSFQSYFSLGEASIQSEISKVEKRFKLLDIHFDQSVATTILSTRINNTNHRISKKLLIDTLEFDIFSDFVDSKDLQKVLNSVYPLHPLTVFSLEKISEMVGQNDRTMFTYVSELEIPFVEYSEYVFSDSLFLYFLSDLNKMLLDNKTINLLKKRSQLLSKQKKFKTEIRILEFMILWNVISGYNPISNEFLMFALGINNKELTMALEILENEKILVFSTSQNQWIPFFQSSRDIKKIVETKIQRDVQNNELEDTLLDLLECKYYLSTSYNYLNAITRYAAVSVCIDNESFNRNSNRSDFDVVLVLSKNKKKANDFSLVDFEKCWIKPIEIDTDEIIYLLKERITLLETKNQYSNLNDNEIEEELDYYISENIKKLSNYTEFIEKQNKIITGNNKIQYLTRVEIEEQLSKKFLENYPNYPIINNDQINKNSISKVQISAINKILDQIISLETENILIEGDGPDKLIYYSVFEKHGLLSEKSEKLSKQYQALKNELYAMIDVNSQVEIFRLIDIACEKPFGIRRPIAPLIVFGLIKKELPNLLLYFEGSYINKIKAQDLYAIAIEGKLGYYFQVVEKTSDFQKYLQALRTIFPNHTADAFIKGNMLLEVLSGINNWLNSLPNIVYSTNLLSRVESDFISSIRGVAIDPNSVIQTLYKKFSRKDILVVKEGLENITKKIACELELSIKKSVKGVKGSLYEVYLNSDLSNKIPLQLIGNETFPEAYSRQVLRVQSESWNQSDVDYLYSQILSDFTQSDHSDTQNEKYYYELAGNRRYINKKQLSKNAQAIYKNLEVTVHAAYKRIPKEEIEQLLVELLQKNIERSGE